ncbi:hypothetical protein B0H34DRAFT_827994 [Crassisporium funariophilum]|nr:hypothetical protein B0H34DRAFT_827994 [Crassisporium funariophilum]
MCTLQLELWIQEVLELCQLVNDLVVVGETLRACQTLDTRLPWQAVSVNSRLGTFIHCAPLRTDLELEFGVVDFESVSGPVMSAQPCGTLKAMSELMQTTPLLVLANSLLYELQRVVAINEPELTSENEIQELKQSLRQVSPCLEPFTILCGLPTAFLLSPWTHI